MEGTLKGYIRLKPIIPTWLVLLNINYLIIRPCPNVLNGQIHMLCGSYKPSKTAY
jgi:hypothetical protein